MKETELFSMSTQPTNKRLSVNFSFSPILYWRRVATSTFLNANVKSKSSCAEQIME